MLQQSIVTSSLIVALTIAGCGSDRPRPTDSGDGALEDAAPLSGGATGSLPEVPESAQRHMTFLNSRIFDRDLSKAMATKVQHVVIDVAGSFSLDVIPERMEKWLVAVQDSDGQVQAQALPSPDQVATRSAALIALVQVAVSYFQEKQVEAKEKALYAPARAYHARLFYQQETGSVTRVTFHRR